MTKKLFRNGSERGMNRYKAKVSATVEMTVWIREAANGEQELDEVDEITEVIEFENVRKLD